MDPLSVDSVDSAPAVPAATSIGPFAALRLLTRETFKLYDTTNSWEPLLSPEQNFIEVLDIPFSFKEDTKIHLKKTDINDDKASIILPTQEKDTIRVYFTENISCHMERSHIETPSFAGSPAMMSQWSLSSKQVQWETHSYKLSLLPTLKGETMIGNAEHPYIDSISIAAGTIRRTLRCIISTKPDGRIICEYIPPM